MRILLVTLSDLLHDSLKYVLSSANEYCAIVVEDLDKAKNFPGNLECPLYPFYELGECVDKFFYDYIICISEEPMRVNMVDEICKYETNLDKLIIFNNVTSFYNFLPEFKLRYYKARASKIEIFVTGLSYAREALESPLFEHNLINLGDGSQDLYYDYRIAETILKMGGGGDTASLCADWAGAVQFPLRYFSLVEDEFPNVEVPYRSE